MSWHKKVPSLGGRKQYAEAMSVQTVEGDCRDGNSVSCHGGNHRKSSRDTRTLYLRVFWL